jgi:hypothetical protein
MHFQWHYVYRYAARSSHGLMHARAAKKSKTAGRAGGAGGCGAGGCEAGRPFLPTPPLPVVRRLNARLGALSRRR